MLIKDRAICIRTVDYSETSQIITLFTRDHGKVSAIAKGSKRAKSKSFDGPLEVLSVGRVMFTESASKESLTTLAEFEQATGFTTLSNNYYAMNCVLFAAELINDFTDEYDPHPELFDILEKFVQHISLANEDRQRLGLLIWFQLKLLDETGLKPSFDYCGNCRKPLSTDWQDAYFSSDKSSLICGDCEKTFPDRLTIGTEAIFCLAAPSAIRQASQETLCQTEKLLLHHIRQTIGKQPRMAKHILP